MGMYWQEIAAYKEMLVAKGEPLVFNGGPASILCTFPNTNQTNLGYLFLTEFFVDSFIVSSHTLEARKLSDNVLGNCHLGCSRSC